MPASVVLLSVTSPRIWLADIEDADLFRTISAEIDAASARANALAAIARAAAAHRRTSHRDRSLRCDREVLCTAG